METEKVLEFINDLLKNQKITYLEVTEDRVEITFEEDKKNVK